MIGCGPRQRLIRRLRHCWRAVLCRLRRRLQHLLHLLRRQGGNNAQPGDAALHRDGQLPQGASALCRGLQEGPEISPGLWLSLLNTNSAANIALPGQEMEHHDSRAARGLAAARSPARNHWLADPDSRTVPQL